MLATPDEATRVRDSQVGQPPGPGRSADAAPGLRRNFSSVLLGNLAYTGCQGAITVVLARLGGTEMLGLFGLGVAVAAPVIELAGMQLHAVQAVDARRRHSFAQYLGMQFVMSTIALAVLAMIALCGPFRAEAAWVVVAVGLSKTAEAFSLVCYGQMRQRERLKHEAWSLALRGVAGLLALTVVFVLAHSVFWSVVALATSWFGIVLFHDYPIVVGFHREGPSPGNVSAKPRETRQPASEPHGGRAWIRPSFEYAALVSIFATAFPLGLFVGINSLNVNAPRYFVEHYFGDRELGLFSAVAYLGLVARMFYTSLLSSLLPRLALYHSAGRLRAFVELVLKSLGLCTALGAVGVLAALVAGKPVLRVVYGQEYAENSFAFLLIVASMAMKTNWMLFLSTLQAMRRFRTVFLLHLTGGLFLTWLLWLLVESHGLVGAAWAILGGSCFDVLIFAAAAAWCVWATRQQAADTPLSIQLQGAESIAAMPLAVSDPPSPEGNR